MLQAYISMISRKEKIAGPEPYIIGLPKIPWVNLNSLLHPIIPPYKVLVYAESMPEITPETSDASIVRYKPDLYPNVWELTLISSSTSLSSVILKVESYSLAVAITGVRLPKYAEISYDYLKLKTSPRFDHRKGTCVWEAVFDLRIISVNVETGKDYAVAEITRSGNRYGLSVDYLENKFKVRRPIKIKVDYELRYLSDNPESPAVGSFKTTGYIEIYQEGAP